MKRKSHSPPPPIPPSSSSSDASHSQSESVELQPQVRQTTTASTGHAKPKPKPKPSPSPSESKSGECEDDSETSSSDSESVQVQPQVTQTAPPNTGHAKPKPLPPPSESKSEECEDDSETSSTDSASVELQPRVTQTAPANTGHAKPKPWLPPSESKSEECEDDSETSGSEDMMTATPAPSTTNKRKSPSDKAKDPSSDPFGAGKKLFQRLWTDEDELAVIKGLVRYNKKHGKDPSGPSEYSVFLDQIKGDLHIEFSSHQLMHKLWNIKRKYKKYMRKLKNGGIASVKEHAQNCFNLLMKVWGDELKTRPSKKDIKNGHVVVENEAMDSRESGPKKKKKKTEAGTQVIENVFEDVLNKHNIEASIKGKLKNALLGMEPKKLQDWEKRFVSQYNLKWDVSMVLNDLESEFIQTLWGNLKP